MVGLRTWAVSEEKNVRSVGHRRIRMCGSQWQRQWDDSGLFGGTKTAVPVVSLCYGESLHFPYDGWGRPKPLQSQCCLSLAFPKDVSGVFIWAPDFCPFPPTPTCCCRGWRGNICSHGWASGPSDLLSSLSKTHTITEGEQLCVTALHEPQYKDLLSLWVPGYRGWRLQGAICWEEPMGTFANASSAKAREATQNLTIGIFCWCAAGSLCQGQKLKFNH